MDKDKDAENNDEANKPQENLRTQKERELLRILEERRKTSLRALYELRDPSLNQFVRLEELKLDKKNSRLTPKQLKEKDEKLQRAKSISRANVDALIEEVKAKKKREDSAGYKKRFSRPNSSVPLNGFDTLRSGNCGQGSEKSSASEHKNPPYKSGKGGKKGK